MSFLALLDFLKNNNKLKQVHIFSPYILTAHQGNRVESPEAALRASPWPGR
jgi:hypothetical protein